jgi:hypothetical protein
VPSANGRAQVCYALKNVYSSLRGDGGMSAKARNDIHEAALVEVMAASGVAVSSDDIGPVARSLGRIERAAALLQPPSFDDTHERFYRLLENDGTGAGA